MELKGIIVDDNDPQKMGRYKVRVMGVHPPDLSKDEIPWSLVRNVGGSGGTGTSSNYRKGDYVILEALDNLASEFRIKGADQTHREPKEKEEEQDHRKSEMDYGKDVADDSAPGSPVPALSTGDIAKLAFTIFELMNSNLFKMIVNSGSGGGGGGFQVPDLDWRDRIVPKEGKIVGKVNEKISNGNKMINTFDYKFELLGIDNIKGYSKDGEVLHIELKGIDVYVPRLVEPGEYTFQYKVTNKNDPTLTGIGNIQIKVEY